MIKRFLFILLISLFTGALQGQEKYALLIGNEDYKNEIGPLNRPIKDVSLIEKSLVSLDFKVVKVSNGNFVDIRKAIAEHVKKVNAAGPNAISFFYYAGHGASDSETKENYLIPVSATSADTSLLWAQSLDLKTEVTDKLSSLAPLATHFVIFDACRNELRLKSNTRELVVGDKAFNKTDYKNKMVIAYSTPQGRTASDNGKYAEILSKQLVKKGIEVVTMFRNVQLDMQDLTTKQEPYTISPSFLPATYLAGRPDNLASTDLSPMKGPDAIVESSPQLNDCPDITIYDFSQNPPKSKIEKRCY